MSSQNIFFQNDKKFIVGKMYETLRVQSPPYRNNYVFNSEKYHEIGTIIPNSEKFLGKYVNTKSYGVGDNCKRYDYFINESGNTISNILAYDGTTRYREIDFYIEEKNISIKKGDE